MNYYKMDEKQVELMGRIINKTSTDYELHGEFIPIESLWSIIEDLYGEIEHLEENIEDIEKDRDDNYRPVTIEKQIDYDCHW